MTIQQYQVCPECRKVIEYGVAVPLQRTSEGAARKDKSRVRCGCGVRPARELKEDRGPGSPNPA